MVFADTGHRRAERTVRPVRLLMVLHALRLECEKWDDSRLLVPPPVSSIKVTMRNQDCQQRTSTRTQLQAPMGLGGNFAVDKFRRPTILQLNIEGLTTSKIRVVEQLAHKNRALVILLQETYCTSADRLILPNYILAGFTQSRKCL